MPGFGDIVQKAFYLGIGLAAYAGEKAGGKISELRSQVQKLADEMVARGEMTTDEARRFVEDMMKQAQQPQASGTTPEKTPPSEPRRIEIIEDNEEATVKEAKSDNVDELREQVLKLQEELKHLQQD
ncbi:MAG TPA: phasin family protein [Nostocaceae cyanobacterium]|nr:phasin family protein [Nostocaceae cyanobacterium]